MSLELDVNPSVSDIFQPEDTATEIFALMPAGHLLNKLADKQLQFQLVLNPCPRSIMWRLKRPSEDSSGEAASRFWNAEDPDSQTEGQSSKVNLHHY